MKRDGKLGWEILCLAALSCPLFGWYAYIVTHSNELFAQISVSITVPTLVLTALLIIREKN